MNCICQNNQMSFCHLSPALSSKLSVNSCPSNQMHKSQNVFVKIPSFICPNYYLYISKYPNEFLSPLKLNSLSTVALQICTAAAHRRSPWLKENFLLASEQMSCDDGCHGFMWLGCVRMWEWACLPVTDVTPGTPFLLSCSPHTHPICQPPSSLAGFFGIRKESSSLFFIL